MGEPRSIRLRSASLEAMMVAAASCDEDGIANAQKAEPANVLEQEQIWSIFPAAPAPTTPNRPAECTDTSMDRSIAW